MSLRVLPQKDVAISALALPTEILRRFAPQDDKVSDWRQPIQPMPGVLAVFCYDNG